MISRIGVRGRECFRSEILRPHGADVGTCRSEPTDERAPSAGAKSLAIPFDQSRWPAIEPGKTKCTACGQDAKKWTLFGRSY